MTKKDTGVSKFIKTLRMCIRYNFENKLIEKAVTNKEHYRHIKYEDLASKPGETLQSLAQWLNLEYIEGCENDFNKTESHALSGNRMRQTATDIKLDESWKDNLPKHLQKLTWSLTS
ncbi:MAG: hypothetical protein ABEI53_03405, partial [Candidatus Magasanikbacteria bacterium]